MALKPWTTSLFVAVCLALLAGSAAQSSGDSSPAVPDDMIAYIVMGVVLAVIVIIIIAILIISCGRWNWNWRNQHAIGKSSRTMRQNVMIAQTSQKPRNKRKNPKLKIGVKENNFQTIDSDNSGSSRALFVMGGNNNTASDISETYSRPSGPHVARVELEGGNNFTQSTNHSQVHSNVTAPAPSTGQSYTSNPNVSLVECQGVHCDVRGPATMDPRPQVPVPQAIYPQLGNVMRPQHQINIHAAVPATVGHTPLQTMPVHHHHQQVVAQPGLYPQLGAHPHTQVIPQTHVGPQIVHGPPAYQTMERKY